ncbi:16804_t:CDS:2, partial [Racocetra persica]
GSMGGMQVLEWSFFGIEYVKTIIPIATSARQSAWCISWSEAQRQSIYSDQKYHNGFYRLNEQPAAGLAAARMSALLTYRSRDSFESRFGRTYQDLNKNPTVNGFSFVKAKTPAEYALFLHNDGLRCNNVNGKSLKSRDQNGNNNIALKQANIQDNDNIEPLDNKEYNLENNNVHSTAAVPHLFSAQSYLRYQGDKFVKRFDANCYISLTRKMDAYDITKDRGDLNEVLGSIKQPTCIIGIESDGLFTISEQYELAEFIPNSEMVTIKSLDGHDGFLIEFDQMNRHILRFTRTHLSEIFEEESCESDGIEENNIEEILVATKNSLFGEAEVSYKPNYNYRIGGSMGGMQVLEWSFFGIEYVKTIIPIATSARQSAWCISWSEAQRQSIYSDQKYHNGFYRLNEQPAAGLAAARMSALLTYRSRDSFESRFGRTYQDLNKNPTVNGFSFVKAKTPAEYALFLHNDGLRCNNVNGKSLKSRDQNGNNNIALKQANIQDNDNIEPLDNKEYNLENNNVHSTAAVPHLFSAQSYLRYQGDKFVKRFDANCYISLTRKMDAYDITKDRGDLNEVLGSIKQPTCIIGIESDGLFTISEQYELAEFIPNSEMVTIKSLDGHDGFLIEFDQMNRHILRFTRTHLSEIFEEESCESDGIEENNIEEILVATKNSLFGEAEVEFL